MQDKERQRLVEVVPVFYELAFDIAEVKKLVVSAVFRVKELSERI